MCNKCIYQSRDIGTYEGGSRPAMQGVLNGSDMRIVLSTVLLLCTLGCSQSDSPDRFDSAARQEPPSRTLTNLVYVDELSSGYQHPLVCGPGGDFPAGEELVFRDAESDRFVHAVFPEEIERPDELQGSFVLHGHYQGIQDRSRYTRKTPPLDYSYFVVSSWEYGE